MNEFSLSQIEAADLRLAHRSEKGKHAAYTINAVLLLRAGWTLEDVKTALLLDVDFYDSFMKTKAKDVEDLFVDAVHPEHNTMAAYGWMRRGYRKESKTNSGHQRIHLHGAIHEETHGATLIEPSAVNQAATTQLFELIEKNTSMHQKLF